EDAHRCAFRVVASSNGATATQVGSGTTIARLKNEWLGATNAHVVDGCGVFAMQYFGDGRPVCVDAKLVGKYYDSARGLDFALLAASRSALDAYNPPVAPLAPPERARLDAASPILSVGCPEAREPQAWKGRVTGRFGEVRQFKPAPLQGQSGSGILQFSPETGVFETRALVTYRTDPSALKDADFDAAEGGALEFALLYDALNVGERGSSGGVPVPRPRTSAGSAVNSARLPFVPCVATTPGGFETALWRSSDAEAKTAAQTSETPSAEAATKPLLLYFRSDDCAPCRSTTPLVEEFARKGWPVRILNIGDAEGGRAWRAYGFRLVPAFAFVELDASGEWFATLDVWTGGTDARRRIERNFAAFKSRDPTRPRPSSTRSTSQALPKFVPCVATVELENAAETEEKETPSKSDLTNGAEEPEEDAAAEEGEETETSTSPLVAETVAAEPGDGPTLPVELEEARLPAVAVGGEFGPDFEPSTAAEALEAFASGWSPFRPGAGGVPEPSGDAAGGGSTDSTAGLIGGAIERAAREKVEALAAELEKAARERIDAVAGELESAARTKAEALAAEVEEAARAKVGELESAARLKLDAAAVAVETAATAKLETAVDGLKRRAGAALAAVGVWGAFAAGAWYWLVRGLAKCWGSAPKYRLVRDDEGASQASTAGSD
ncbi:MAG: trypsin-like peptidase domain-containing protein, partial [Thermoguttaceae bacterium]|nr:trypsin-like peptidase domain-containing protein [Thermoguttaceae bacterium]